MSHRYLTSNDINNKFKELETLNKQEKKDDKYLKKQVKTLKKKVESLTEDVQTEKEKNKQIKKDFADEKNRLVSENDAEKIQLKNQNDKLANLSRALQTRSSELENNLKQEKETNELLQKELDTAGKQRSAFSNMYDNIKKSLEEAKAKNKKLADAAQTLSKNGDVLYNEFIQEKDKNTQLQAENAELMKKLEDTEKSKEAPLSLEKLMAELRKQGLDDATIALVTQNLPQTSNLDNKHLTRTEKENIIHFMPQGELNEKGKYNLNDRLAAVNDNQGLLDKLDREAAITANIDIKAIDAKKSVEAEKTGTVEIRAEHNHSTEHGSNNQALIAEIQSGTIDKNTVIAIERKQYGENQGMKDIIKIASILEHNEKNPGNPLKLPEKLENTLIFQDALLYKTAKEKGIKIISLEGGNLEHTKESALYNENREQYMANVINEVRSKGYNVIANVGASHVANLEKALENQQKHDVGFSHIPRKIRQGPSANNQRESTGFSHIPEGILQEASAIAKKIPAGRVKIESVNKSNTLKKSGQGRG